MFVPVSFSSFSNFLSLDGEFSSVNWFKFVPYYWELSSRSEAEEHDVGRGISPCEVLLPHVADFIHALAIELTMVREYLFDFFDAC